MSKITFNELERIMSYSVVKNKTCIEIDFYIDGCVEYSSSWLGKVIDNDTDEASYWFGLTEDGLQAYDFNSFEEFTNAKVFKGKSLKDIWHLVSLYSIDGFNVQERLPFYSSENS